MNFPGRIKKVERERGFPHLLWGEGWGGYSWGWGEGVSANCCGTCLQVIRHKKALGGGLLPPKNNSPIIINCNHGQILTKLDKEPLRAFFFVSGTRSKSFLGQFSSSLPPSQSFLFPLTTTPRRKRSKMIMFSNLRRRRREGFQSSC